MHYFANHIKFSTASENIFLLPIAIFSVLQNKWRVLHVAVVHAAPKSKTENVFFLLSKSVFLTLAAELIT